MSLFPRGRHARKSRSSAAVATGAAAAFVAIDIAAAGAASAASSSDFAKLRQCESGGNYSINTGNGYYGAYQFDLSTWRSVGQSGYPHKASKSTQDQAAATLQARRGWQPWPTCSRQLGLRGGGGSGGGESAESSAPARQQASAPARRSNVKKESSASSSTAYNGRQVTYGRGPAFYRADVKMWQRQMANRGWDIKVDGYYGPQSRAVCAAFQRNHGLNADNRGLVGRQVWNSAFNR